MGLNIKAITSYVKACNVKSILQTKPPTLKGVNFAELKPLTEDVFVKTAKVCKKVIGKFSKIEQQAMEKLRLLTKENAIVIDNAGNPIKELKFDGNKSQCWISNGEILMNNPNIMKRMEGGTLVHNHVFEGILSMEDLSNLFSKKVLKVMATTPGGGYSSIAIPKGMELSDELALKIGQLYGNEISFIQKLLGNKNLTNTQRWDSLNKWRINQFEELARNDGFEFAYKIGKKVTEPIDLSKAA